MIKLTELEAEKLLTIIAKIAKDFECEKYRIDVERYKFGDLHFDREHYDNVIEMEYFYSELHKKVKQAIENGQL